MPDIAIKYRARNNTFHHRGTGAIGQQSMKYVFKYEMRSCDKRIQGFSGGALTKLGFERCTCVRAWIVRRIFEKGGLWACSTDQHLCTISSRTDGSSVCFGSRCVISSLSMWIWSQTLHNSSPEIFELNTFIRIRKPGQDLICYYSEAIQIDFQRLQLKS